MSRAERRALVEREVPALPVSRQCQLLSISRASVYRRPTEISAEDCTIMTLLDRQFLSRPFYGSRRMAAWLATQGHIVNRKRVQRLMRLAGLVAIFQRAGTSAQALPRHIHPDGPGLSLPGGYHGLDEPGGAGVAAIEHARGGVLRRGPRRSALAARPP